jgi:hypothetical protein
MLGRDDSAGDWFAFLVDGTHAHLSSVPGADFQNYRFA